VATCIDTMQIEGKAEILGSPLDEKSKKYAEIYSNKNPALFKAFSVIPGMTMVKMTPTFFATYFRDNPANRYFEHCDLGDKVTYVFERV